MCRTCTAGRERMLFQRVVYKGVMGKPSSEVQFAETNQEMQEVGLISSRDTHQVKSWKLEQSLLSYRRHYSNCPVSSTPHGTELYICRTCYTLFLTVDICK